MSVPDNGSMWDMRTSASQQSGTEKEPAASLSASHTPFYISTLYTDAVKYIVSRSSKIIYHLKLLVLTRICLIYNCTEPHKKTLENYDFSIQRQKWPGLNC
jgi:hypothetical protein